MLYFHTPKCLFNIKSPRKTSPWPFSKKGSAQHTCGTTPPGKCFASIYPKDEPFKLVFSFFPIVFQIKAITTCFTFLSLGGGVWNSFSEREKKRLTWFNGCEKDEFKPHLKRTHPFRVMVASESVHGLITDWNWVQTPFSTTRQRIHSSYGCKWNTQTLRFSIIQQFSKRVFPVHKDLICFFHARRLVFWYFSTFTIVNIYKMLGLSRRWNAGTLTIERTLVRIKSNEFNFEGYGRTNRWRCGPVKARKWLKGKVTRIHSQRFGVVRISMNHGILKVL